MEAIGYAGEKVTHPHQGHSPLVKVQVWLAAKDTPRETGLIHGICGFASFYLIVHIFQSFF
ncbi:MAG: hypothetical protein PHC60_07420 [Heliobacteriaceae bacterium]|nr:hypothetical protein [Heliobacteriaceae bacterium]MDD4588200.1 hypothetical protein [Heliobacteriaceae bacterium]